MQKSNRRSWSRMLFAAVAATTIGGAGIVFAASPAATYTPTFAAIEGNGDPPVGSGTPYTLYVTFSNGTTGSFTTTATWSVASGGGSFTANIYTPAAPGRVLLKGSYSSGGVTVTSSRAVIAQ